MAIYKITNVLPWQLLPKHLRIVKNPQEMASTRAFSDKILKNQHNNNTHQRLYPLYDETLWLRSCEKEVREPVQGKVVGTIPTWLNGSLLRNGPGKLKFGTDEFQHLFDASALVHKFKIENGNVTYQCKFIESEAYKNNLKSNRIVSNEFGTTKAPDPCLSIFQRFAAMFQSPVPSDNASISLYPFGDEMYAFSESRVLYKINHEDLSTEEPVHLNEHIAILHNTSHPHVDKDGTVFNLGLTIQSIKPQHIIICHPIANCGEDMFKQSKIVASIPAQWPFHPCYMHSFGITENYYIIVEQPLTLSVPKIVISKIVKGNSLASTLEWFPGEHPRFNVISRKTGKLHRTFVADTFFYFHIIHQFEQEDHLIMDICTYDDAAVIDSMYTESLRTMQSNPNFANSFRARPDRFVLPLNPDPMSHNKVNLVKLDNTKAEAYHLPNGEIIAKPERICDIGCELPRINDNYLGKPYRYFYAIDSDVDGKSPGSIIKVDTVTKEIKRFWEEKCHLNEPVFVPSPSAKAEDDGVIITSMVWEHEERRVGLIILNAENFTEIGRVVFDTTTTIPKTFHGWFKPNKS